MIPFIFQPTNQLLLLILNSFLPKLIYNYINIILSQTNNNWSFSLGWAVTDDWRLRVGPCWPRPVTEWHDSRRTLPKHSPTTTLYLSSHRQCLCYRPLRYVVFVFSNTPSLCRWKCPRVLLCAVSSELCFIIRFALWSWNLFGFRI